MFTTSSSPTNLPPEISDHPHVTTAMIEPRRRFFVYSGMLHPWGHHKWSVIDYELRRCVEIGGSDKLLPEDEDALRIMAKIADDIPLHVHLVEVSDELELTFNPTDTHTRPYCVQDPTHNIRYPHFEAKDEREEAMIIRRGQLSEMDRLDICVDLVQPMSGKDAGKLRVFKYEVLDLRVHFTWKEAHISRALRGHPSFICLEQFVIDDVKPWLLGFTMDYVDGGTLENYYGTFRFDWLRGLTSAIDDLHFRYGVVHQDVAPRNILLDLATMSLKLFDFERAARIGSDEEDAARSDINGMIFTLYEALTKDDHYRKFRHEEQNVKLVEGLEHWELKLDLEPVDGGLLAYRGCVATWAEERRSNRKIKNHADAAEPLEWPDFEPLPVPKHFWREEAYQAGEYVVCWERGLQPGPSRKVADAQAKTAIDAEK